VQKTTFALAGLAIAAAGGMLITSSPAHAGALVQGHRHHHYSSHRNYNRNANWNRNHNRVVVRVNVRNRNVNTAFAGREREDEFGFFRHRRCGFGCNRFNRFDRFDRFDRDDDGFGRDRDDDDRGDNIIVGNDFRTAGHRD
jgi:hypothetical protein